MTNRVAGPELVAFVEARGYLAKPIKCLKVVGYTLRGPRRSKTVIAAVNGRYDIEAAALWCDGVDYATAKIQKRRARL